MNPELGFISEDVFRKHVEDTIDKYGEKLKPFPVRLAPFNFFSTSS